MKELDLAKNLLVPGIIKVQAKRIASLQIYQLEDNESFLNVLNTRSKHVESTFNTFELEMTDIPYEFRLEKVLVQYQRANSKIALQARQIEELTSKLKKYKKYKIIS